MTEANSDAVRITKRRNGHEDRETGGAERQAIAGRRIKPDGSLLDEGNLALIAEMAEQSDAQVWVERVGDGKECHVVIEDGKVKA